ncbi:Zn-dependent hydrolase [Robertkochia marina]|uniref:Zn-dependent hydrolase n=1 Tax=Robertkochia marina TaxID=1227945 RepID=A0A4S3M286_9FLAO|nr:Zn-dependent hydrolase [Robertkochia marina]THD67585.1 Zn-dependent hydrolase [Robertkochia marina]TRZ44546.1 Zn-dependent hydrolase [Robertkochia marina]
MKKLILTGIILSLVACQTNKGEQKSDDTANDTIAMNPIQQKVDEFAEFTLTTDVSVLSEKEKQMLPLLIEAAQIMDKLFWKEAYGSKDSLMAELGPAQKAFAEINYGPWERLNDDKPFVEGVGPKPEGAQFYPEDMTKEEFEAWDNPDKANAYSFVRRDENGELYLQPYHEAFKEEVSRAAELLRQAAELAEEEGLKKYLTLRADALENDEYLESDMAWMDMKNNSIDVVIGPIENYEDKLYNYRNAHEAYVLIKDKSWSERLEKYASFLPELQKGLPVDAPYKKEMPGTSSQLNAYDVIYYAGDCNAGSKTIAINLPNDERVQLEKGSRRLQLKNAMQAKFDKILEPISEVLVAEEQRKHITFDAFFANTMFHEVAHGLGIKNTINGSGTVREALKEKGSALEEGKADILGLYMVTKLHEMGEIEGELMDYYVTFMAGIFRSVRFGAASAHGQANMVRFNYFQEMDAFSFDEATGQYAVNFENFQQAMNSLSEKILTLQGDGDYDGVTRLFEDMGHVSPELQNALDRVSEAGIPRDIVFEQGTDVLGL